MPPVLMISPILTSGNEAVGMDGGVTEEAGYRLGINLEDLLEVITAGLSGGF